MTGRQLIPPILHAGLLEWRGKSVYALEKLTF
jgi:hypothetical protein